MDDGRRLYLCFYFCCRVASVFALASRDGNSFRQPVTFCVSTTTNFVLYELQAQNFRARVDGRWWILGGWLRYCGRLSVFGFSRMKLATYNTYLREHGT